MTDSQQILEKALLKAHRNGWKPLNKEWKNVEVTQWQGNGMVGIALLYSENDNAVQWVRELEGIIFNHDFAKALWGEQGFPGEFTGKYPNPIPPNGDVGAQRGWKHHLQQMVIAEDPIAYLGANI